MIRGPWRIGALLGALIISAGVGWDGALWDARLQLGLHIAAMVAIGAVIWAARRGGPMPRTRIDLAILALLVAYAAATLFGWRVGISAPALAGIVATAFMLPVALLALRHHPNATALVAVLPVLALSVGTLGTMAWRRIDWTLAGGVGWPPVRLANEGTLFGSVAVPPFVILAALPIALLVTQPGVRRWLLWALVTVGVPLTLLSGSRSAWIAIGVAGLVMAASSLADLRGLLRASRRSVAIWTLLASAAAVAIAFVAPRLTDTSSLLYRGQLWQDTLTVWRSDPLLGVGPGAMPYARQVIEPVLQLHSHDVPLGILGDAGVVGLAAALVLFAQFVRVARPRRGHAVAGRAAFAVLMGIAVGFLTEDLTFLPNVNLLLLLLAAIALRDAGAVAWRPIRLGPTARPLAGLAGVAAIALLSVAMPADASAVFYRSGIDAAAASDWPAARDALAVAVALNPGHPAGPKSLAVAAERQGSEALALGSARRAVGLNPGDWASWTNLSLLCLEARDATCALDAARQSVLASHGAGLALVNAALVYEALGYTVEADNAYRAARLTLWQITLAVPWPRTVVLADPGGIASGTFTGQLALLVARRQSGSDLRADAYTLASIRAVAFAMQGNRAAAAVALEAATREQATDSVTWDIAALLMTHWGEDDARALRIGDVTRGGPLSDLAPEPPPLTYDIASLRAYPGDGLVSKAERMLLDRPWPWVLEPLLDP